MAGLSQVRSGMIARQPWWSRERHADRRPFLAARNRVTSAVRGWFGLRGFTEVECASLQVSPGNETHLHAFAVEASASSGEAARLYLHTSPEFACKKLLAAGETRIFNLARVYRDREHAALNLPEFTMLEWYRAHEEYDAVIADCVALVRLAAAEAANEVFDFRGRSVEVGAEAERLSVSDAFARHAGIDLLPLLSPDGGAEAFARAAQRAGVATHQDDTWSDIFARVLAERIEPHLGCGRLTVLDRYPASEAALARRCADDSRVAERFEVYACGVELANGFGELTDAEEQRRRFEAEMDEKERRYGLRYPIDEDLLAALKEMPQASGVALGFDRLVMLATGAQNIEQVLWTPPAGRS